MISHNDNVIINVFKATVWAFIFLKKRAFYQLEHIIPWDQSLHKPLITTTTTTTTKLRYNKHALSKTPPNSSSHAKNRLSGLPNLDYYKNRSSTQYTTINYVFASFVRLTYAMFFVFTHIWSYLHICAHHLYFTSVSHVYKRRVQQL